jgi:FAD:protein FMN transferase
MKTTISYILVLSVLFLIGYLIAGGGNKDNKIIRSQILLGTVVEIQAEYEDDLKASEAVNAAFAEMKRIDDLFSSYNIESEVYKLNHSNDFYPLHPEVYKLLLKCKKLNEISYGSFDVTIGKVINLWDFENKIIPRKKELTAALASSGFNQLEYYEDLIKINNAELNFGAAAKGYAVDRGIKILKEHDIPAALINAGGEVSAYGKEWIIGIRHPRMPNALIDKIKINNKSAATSGDYEQYFIRDGKRFHHIIDPSTGFPAAKNQSVTVVAGDDFTADALATALFILDFSKSLQLVETLPGVEAMIIDSSGSIFYSTGFNEYLIKD